jgi:hypothetical protein
VRWEDLRASWDRINAEVCRLVEELVGILKYKCNALDRQSLIDEISARINEKLQTAVDRESRKQGVPVRAFLQLSDGNFNIATGVDRRLAATSNKEIDPLGVDSQPRGEVFEALYNHGKGAYAERYSASSKLTSGYLCKAIGPKIGENSDVPWFVLRVSFACLLLLK